MFRTEIEAKSYSFKIDHKSEVVMLGSCFSETIGSRLLDHKFSVLKNPFGTLFHPISIFNLIEKSINNEKIDDWSIIDQDNAFISHQLHSSKKAKSKDDLLSNFQEMAEALKIKLTKAEVLVLTLGTAFEFRSKSNGKHVANCHKVPQSNFTKHLCTIHEIIQGFQHIDDLLKTINPDLKILLTVSPVRHTKDSIELNSSSKSTLRVACLQMETQFNDVHYFPSYEIMMDDLRDYRFYEKDLIHPNEQAIDYIWNFLEHSFFNESTRDMNNKIRQVRQSLAHKAFNPDSEAHQKFLKRTLEQLQELNEQLPFNEEIERIKAQLTND